MAQFSLPCCKSCDERILQRTLLNWDGNLKQQIIRCATERRGAPPNAVGRFFGACVGGRRTTERRGAFFWCLCWGLAYNGERILRGFVRVFT